MAVVLIIDDEEEHRLLLTRRLQGEGLDARAAHDGEEGLELAFAMAPDIIVLDRMLPGIDGFEVLKRLRAAPRTKQVRVLMLTRKGDALDRVQGLELGADDYLPKPFLMPEAVARVKALLRRPSPRAGTVYEFGPLRVDPEAATARLDGRPTALSATEFKLLVALAEAGGVALSREKLRDRIWGVGFAVTPRTVDVHLKRLREKLGPAGPRLIKTVRGIGYKLEA